MYIVTTNARVHSESTTEAMTAVNTITSVYSPLLRPHVPIDTPALICPANRTPKIQLLTAVALFVGRGGGM